jgi:hypothetical protein
MVANKNFIALVESMINTESRDLVINPEWSAQLELLPVALSLNHNRYFRSFELRDVKKKEAIQRASEFLEDNRTIR